jgi:hypothetical protein
VKRFVLAGLFILSGCTSQYATNDESRVFKSHNGPGLVVPKPLTTANISYFYNLPPQEQDAHVSIAPPLLD